LLQKYYFQSTTENKKHECLALYFSVMKSIHIKSYQSPLGELILGVYEEQLCLCDWKYRKQRESVDNRLQSGLKAAYKEEKHSIIDLAINQLEAYFDGSRETFDVPLLLEGTAFQESVWQALLQIPYGETRSYLQLSKSLGNELAIRAVAAANGANALSIFVPCHRIVGSDGSLTGYAGGLAAKKKLLQLEGVNQQMELF
jgi:methylated-DNA-[protein]-cysteine S-methyltransferase